MHLSVTEIVHELVRPHLHPGDTAFDATAGNGHDTLFLAGCVGPTGRVLAWDIQKLAIERTAALLAKQGVTWVELTLRDHAEIEKFGAGEFAAAMFNLGYLPASDRTITTTADSSVRAIRAAAELLKVGGILTVLAYVGHPGGIGEAAAVEKLLRGMPSREFDFVEVPIPGGRSAPPQLFGLERRLLR